MYDPNLFPARAPPQGTERPQIVFKRSRPPVAAPSNGTLWVGTADGYRVFSLSGSAGADQQRLGLPGLLEKRLRVPKVFDARYGLGDFSVSDDATRDLEFQLSPDWNWGRRELSPADRRGGDVLMGLQGTGTSIPA